ncbi:MAG: radical SAM protein [Promethearchaeia archaeon]
MEYKYLKKVESQTLGNALQINFNPLKVCSFNCIFCDLGHTTRLLMEREMFYPPEEIFSEINDYIKDNDEPDYLLTGNGESMLYLGFKQLSEMIKDKYPNLKIAVSSNGSLLHRKDVREDFLISDRVTVNLNTINPQDYLKISRHHKDVNLNNVLKGIKLFREKFKGEFGISTVFVKGINDSESNVQNLKSFLLEINPDMYIINGFTENKEESISEDFKDYVKEMFKDVNFEVFNRME